jgi:molecular chaperone DnaK (HSP70)
MDENCILHVSAVEKLSGNETTVRFTLTQHVYTHVLFDYMHEYLGKSNSVTVKSDQVKLTPGELKEKKSKHELFTKQTLAYQQQKVKRMEEQSMIVEKMFNEKHTCVVVTCKQ